MPLRPSRSFKVTDFGTNRKLVYDFLLLINSNLPPILQHFRDIAVDKSKIAILGYPSCLTPPAEGFPWDNLREIFSGCQWAAKVPNAIEILPKIWTAWVGHTNVTDRQMTDDSQMDGWQHIANVTSRSLKIQQKSEINGKKYNIFQQKCTISLLLYNLPIEDSIMTIHKVQMIQDEYCNYSQTALSKARI